MNRRHFLQSAGALALSAIALPRLRAADDVALGKADSCIMLWLGGGASQVDTWDPKRLGDPAKKVAGSAYAGIPTAVPGIQVCEHLKRSAALMDRMVLMRTINHPVIDEHAAATLRMHTGRPTTETVTYPSLGSIVAHEKPAGGDGVPAYVVIGYPNVTRGPGFLGSSCGYVYLTETDTGPAGLSRPQGVSESRQQRRDALAAKLREGAVAARPGDLPLSEYATAAAAGFKLAGPDFMKVFDLRTESPAVRAEYGGEFGQRCLLARRLVESGVRFVEVSFNLNFVNGTGWDSHNEGQQGLPQLIDGLDQALSGLIQDLERRKRLDRTLIVVNTEFGRPPEFDGGGGRGHQGKAFSVVLAGGGLRTGKAIGTTDELGKSVADRPVSVPDLFATCLNTLGIDPHTELYAGARPVPVTDGGKPVAELFG